MNWKGIKNLLIVLLLLADVFLGYMLISQNRQGQYDENSIDNASEILARGGIIADRRILEKKDSELPLCTVSAAKNTEVVMRKILVGDVTESFAVPDGAAFFTDTGEQLRVTDDLSLLYSEDGTIKDTESVVFSPPTDENSGSYTSALEKLLTPNGVGDDKFGFEINGVSEGIDSVFVSATQTLNGVKIQNHTVFCEIKDGKVIYAHGTWCFLPIKEKKSAHIIDGINILFIEKNNSGVSRDEIAESDDTHIHRTETKAEEETKNADTAAKETFSAENFAVPSEKITRTVVSLESCYCSERVFGADLIYIVPSYRIEWLDGSVSYYNAITGEAEIVEY